MLIWLGTYLTNLLLLSRLFGITFDVKIKVKALFQFCLPLFMQNFVHILNSRWIMSFLSLVSWIIPLRKLICIDKLGFVTDNLFYKLEIHRKFSLFPGAPNSTSTGTTGTNGSAGSATGSALFTSPGMQSLLSQMTENPQLMQNMMNAPYTQNMMQSMAQVIFGIIFMYCADIVRRPQNFKKLSHFFWEDFFSNFCSFLGYLNFKDVLLGS